MWENLKLFPLILKWEKKINYLYPKWKHLRYGLVFLFMILFYCSIGYIVWSHSKTLTHRKITIFFFAFFILKLCVWIVVSLLSNPNTYCHGIVKNLIDSIETKMNTWILNIVLHWIVVIWGTLKLSMKLYECICGTGTKMFCYSDSVVNI